MKKIIRMLIDDAKHQLDELAAMIFANIEYEKSIDRGEPEDENRRRSMLLTAANLAFAVARLPKFRSSSQLFKIGGHHDQQII